MRKLVTTLIAVAAFLTIGVGLANADTYTVEEQCRVATIPTALCNGDGTVGSSESSGVDRVKYVDRGKYLSGFGPEKTIGYYDGEPIEDEDGNPVLDDEGNPTFVQLPIIGGGDPIYSTYPQAQAGQRDNDGNLVVSY